MKTSLLQLAAELKRRLGDIEHPHTTLGKENQVSNICLNQLNLNDRKFRNCNPEVLSPYVP